MDIEIVSQDIIERAYDLNFSDEFDELEALLEPYKESKDVRVQYLLEAIKVDDRIIGFSDEEMDKRYLQSLMDGSDQGVAPASYHLAIHYWNGDGVEKDLNKAGELFKKAAYEGDGKSMLTHGENLCFGHFGNSIDIPEGLRLIKGAVNRNIEHAEQVLIRCEKLDVR